MSIPVSILFINSGKELANSFPASINAIKTSNMKLIQVSTSANVNSEKISNFTFPVKFTPTGFIGCVGNIIKNGFDGSLYTSSFDTNFSITSFSYVDGTFLAVSNQAIASKEGTSSYHGISRYCLYTNSTSLSDSRRYDVDITSTQVTISAPSSKNTSFFIQGNYTNGYWYVVYWA